MPNACFGALPGQVIEIVSFDPSSQAEVFMTISRAGGVGSSQATFRRKPVRAIQVTAY
jgi:hypothetical protein